MRVLLLLRGSAGCGKTTWIEQNGLKDYALSADDFRTLCASPVMTAEGGLKIDGGNDKFAWKTLFTVLEQRMRNGEFTVVDATNSKTQELKRYKKLASEYKYRLYCADFTDIPIETVKQRNASRPEIKRVPEDVIDRMYSRFKTQKIPSGFTVISPDELDKIWLKPRDLNAYKRVHVIGDIHGCHTALSEYFEKQGGFKDDEFYIFCGDYTDRGIENGDTMKFLFSLYDRPNVSMLEGNHERWLNDWSYDKATASQEFESGTRAQLEQAGISKKEARRFYKRLGQCAYFNYGANTYLVTHAGLSTLPENLTKVSAKQMIRGVGDYDDFETVAESFRNNTPENVIQVHGHRNTKHLPVQVRDRVFNLEGQTEYGGCLRCLIINPDGSHVPVETQNTVFKPPIALTGNVNLEDVSPSDVITALRLSPYVAEKRFGNISSFNFTKKAFFDRIWDEQTVKARGLYFNTREQRVMARAYDKFFNIDERPETELKNLQAAMTFPVTAYVKENGFLGIVSYNSEDDSLFVTTKSDPSGDFAVWFKDMLYDAVDDEVLDELKAYLKEKDVSFVFEVVNLDKDPHIIEYDGNRIYLLDIVKNSMVFEKYDYEKLVKTAERFGFKYKEKAAVIPDWPQFFDWYRDVTKDGYRYNGRLIEGFVLEDAAGYMLKLKLFYYRFWKHMQNVANETKRRGYLDNRVITSLASPLANSFYGWVKALYENDAQNAPNNIYALREMFLKSDEGAPLREMCRAEIK